MLSVLLSGTSGGIEDVGEASPASCRLGFQTRGRSRTSIPRPDHDLSVRARGASENMTEFDQTLDTVVQQALQELAAANQQVMRRNRELAAVNTAVFSISRTPDLAHVLQSIVDAVRELIQSRYAALGVADERGRIVQFLTSGISPEEWAAI